MNKTLKRKLTGQPWLIFDTNVLNSICCDECEPEEIEDVDLLSRYGNIDIITVSGIITKNNLEVGQATIEKIKDAFNRALVSDSKTILFVFDSPGGSSSGVADLAEYIRNASFNNYKAIISFSDSVCASGAYWLASATNDFLIGNTTLVGSIGAISVTMDTEGMLKQMGITPFVATSGEQKGAGGSVGGHSETQKRGIQAQVNKLAQVFAGSVQAYRGLTNGEIEALTDAGVHIGDDAVKMKLADAVTTYEKVLAVYN